MKILQISPQNVFPPIDGGKVSIFNIFKTLNELGIKTDIAFYYNNIDNLEYFEKWNNLGNLFPLKLNTQNTKFRILSSFFQNKSLYLTKHINNDILAKYEELIDTNNYSAIVCDHTAMAPVGLYLKNKYNLPTFLRLHNIEYLIWERYYKELNIFNPLRLFIHQQATLLKEYESYCLDKFDYVFTINENEMKFAKKMNLNANIDFIPAGVDNEMWSYNEEDFKLKNDNIIAIATNYNWVHNVNGIDWFITQVLPMVREEIPDVKLKLFGKNIPDKFKNNEENGIYAIGFVEDIVSELKKAKVYIAPLFVGAGIRIKILEAMACGLPVIATSVSADGINANSKNGLFVENNSINQAKIIIELLKDKNKLQKLSLGASEYIKENYNWKKSISKMYKIIQINTKYTQ